MTLFSTTLQAVLLVVSLTTDAFAASLSYGAEGIKIPFPSAATISGVCSLMLAAAMVFGNMAASAIPDGITKWIGFSLLLLMGFIRLIDRWIKNFIRSRKEIALCFGGRNFHVIMTIYADAGAADQDQSKELSVAEAATLSLALPLDSLAAGFGAAMAEGSAALCLGLSLILTYAAIRFGCALGTRIAKSLSFDLSYLSGALLVLLAVLRVLRVL